MLAAQMQYGRDGAVVRDEGAIALGRALWRTVPEDCFDIGPQYSRDNRYWLVADIRIDNREELIVAAGLHAKEAAASLCDAALLLLAIEKWGLSALDRIIGPYAFALWDSEQAKMHLVRDPFGLRPLFFHRSANLFAFATTAKGLHALPQIPKAANFEELAALHALWPFTSERTCYKEIDRVMPGQILSVTSAGVTTEIFWRPEAKGRHLRLGSAEAYAEGLRYHIDQATKAQLRGVRNLATHLSGGLDSSTATATAARWLSGEGGRVVAFTSVPREGFDSPLPAGTIGDEGPLAATTAAMYPNIEHVLVRTNIASPLADLDHYVRLFEYPALNTLNANWGMNILRQAQSRGLDVLLTAGFGNLTMSYNGLEYLAEMVRHAQFGKWWRAAKAARQARVVGRFGILARSFGPWMPDWLWVAINQARGRRMDRENFTATRPEALRALADAAPHARGSLAAWGKPSSDSLAFRLSMIRQMDAGTYFKAGLAEAGIDIRDISADLRLAEFCLSVPAEQFFDGGRLRGLLRRAVADRLPPAVLNEQRIGYQSADWHETLTRALPQLREEIELLADFDIARKWIDVDRLRHLIDTWPKEGWHKPEIYDQYHGVLMRAVVVGHFMRRAAGGNR